jgi:hypothetical protein
MRLTTGGVTTAVMRMKFNRSKNVSFPMLDGRSETIIRRAKSMCYLALVMRLR